MAGQSEVQEPTWLAAIQDAALREEAKKAYLMQTDYTKKTQALSEKEQSYQQQLQDYQTLKKWYEEQYLPFHQQAAPIWDDFKAFQQMKRNGMGENYQQQAYYNQEQRSVPNNSLASQIDFSNWDLLPEQERVNRILGAAQSQYERQVAAKERVWAEAIANALNQSRAGDYRYWNLVTDALEKKVDNPKLALRDLLKEAMDVQRQIQEGKFNPLDLAFTKLTSAEQDENKKKEWMKAGREEHQRELDAQKQESGVRGSGPIPVLKQAPRSPKEISQAVQAEAEKKGIPWLSQ